jgi:hypothetical protein
MGRALRGRWELRGSTVVGEWLCGGRLENQNGQDKNHVLVEEWYLNRGLRLASEQVTRDSNFPRLCGGARIAACTRDVHHRLPRRHGGFNKETVE